MNTVRSIPGKFVTWLHQPEYTGSNRCLACTIVNLVIAAVFAAAIAILSLPAAGVVFLCALGLIGVRGYLVPGTPTLTKRYLPDRVLAWFDKERRIEPQDDIDVQEVLFEAGVLVDDPDADIAIDPAFERAWFDRIAQLDVTDPDLDELGDLLDIDPDRLAASYFADGACTVYLDDEWLGQWESAAAFTADVAAELELTERYVPWGQLPLSVRSEVLAGLRLCLDRCPACNGVVSLEHQLVESCCRSIDVVAASCHDCGTSLFEVEYSPD